VLLTEPRVDLGALAARTGWSIKPEGACCGDQCIPLPAGASDGTTVDARVLSERLGAPLVVDDKHGLWALGPAAAVTGRALTTAVAPDVSLPGVDGTPFQLSSMHGRKVLLVAWASW